jgi:type IV secretory pathway TrbL component
MSKTRNIQKRINNESLNTQIFNKLSSLGLFKENSQELTPKQCKLLIKNLQALKRTIDKIGEKGGYTLILENDTEITTYRNNSFNKKKAAA